VKPENVRLPISGWRTAAEAMRLGAKPCDRQGGTDAGASAQHAASVALVALRRSAALKYLPALRILETSKISGMQSW